MFKCYFNVGSRKINMIRCEHSERYILFLFSTYGLLSKVDASTIANHLFIERSILNDRNPLKSSLKLSSAAHCFVLIFTQKHARALEVRGNKKNCDFYHQCVSNEMLTARGWRGENICSSTRQGTKKIYHSDRWKFSHRLDFCANLDLLADPPSFNALFIG